MARRVGLIVPVYKNFPGFAELMASVDIEVLPIIIPNWIHNNGVSGGWNMGLHRARVEQLDAAFIIGDDVVLEKGTMSKMLMGLAEHDLVTGYNTRDEKYSDTTELYIQAPDYSCFVVDPIMFVSKFGWFDEEFSPAYFEDNDMDYRIKVAGGSSKKHTKAPFHHKGSVTQNWNGEQVVNSAMFEKNRDYYRSKWGGTPGEERFIFPFESRDEETGMTYG